MAESLQDIERKILAREAELEREQDKEDRRLLRAELVQLREKENMLLKRQQGAASGSGQAGAGAGAGAAAGTFKFSQEPFIKVEADSLTRHPFMPVTLRHCWDESIAMSAAVMLDTGNAATGITGIYLPRYQVQKLQLRPLGGTKEVECWGGGTTRLQQYEPIWVEVNLTNPATQEQKQRRAVLNVWTMEPSASAAVEAPGSTSASAPQPASTLQPASAPQPLSASAVCNCKPKVEMQHSPQPAASASQHEPGTPTRPPDAASSRPTTDEFELSPLKRPAQPGDEFAMLSFQGMQMLGLTWDINRWRISTRFIPVQIL